MTRQRAFTLIELLVVIAIIGLLTTLVLVNTSGTRDKGRIAKALEFSGHIYNALGSEVVGIWNFDNGTGTIAYDTSGYGNNGTINNGAYFSTSTPYSTVGAGTGRYSLYFDGADDYVSVPHNTIINPVSQLTISAWVKLNQPSSGWNTWPSVVVKRTGGSNTGYSLRFDQVSSKLMSIVGNGASTNTITSNKADWVANVWYYIVAVWDLPGGKSYIYVNGSQDVTLSTNIASISGETRDLHIGSDNGNPTSAIQGLIDDVRIYGTALSAMEIRQHYAGGLGKHQNLAILQNN